MTLPSDGAERAVSEVAALLAEAFAPDGGSLAGTAVLFDPEGRGPEPSRPATWREVAERTREVDFDAPHHLSPEDFRAYLPGLLLGGLLDRESGHPVAEAAAWDLFQNYYDSWWDRRFMDRWCHFTPVQYDAIAAAVALLFPDPEPGSAGAALVEAVLGLSYPERARRTLELVRLHRAVEALEGPAAEGPG